MSNPPQVATSSDRSNIATITDAVFAIARDHAGVSWMGTKEWDLPTQSEVAAAGWPYLAVTWPRFVEYSVGYEPVGEFMARSMETQFTWDIDVYCLTPYSAGDPAVFSTPTAIAAQLLQTFTLYENLNGTCDEAKVGKPQLVKISEKSPNGGIPTGPPLWFAAILTIRVIEQIETDYTPAG